VVFPNSSSGREDGTLRAAKSGEVPGTIDYTMNRADVTRILRNAKTTSVLSGSCPIPEQARRVDNDQDAD